MTYFLKRVTVPPELKWSFCTSFSLVLAKCKLLRSSVLFVWGLFGLIFILEHIVVKVLSALQTLKREFVVLINYLITDCVFE